MYQVYKLISLLLYPLIRILLLWRVKKGKEDPFRYKEKLGFFEKHRPKSKLIWFHAASIGEFNAILPIVKEISKEYPKINILLTTVTLTAANIAKNNLPPNAIHQFAPLDCYNIIARFINHWQPDLVIWTESEFWPNMLMVAKKRAKLLLINARLSKKSFNKWSIAKSLAKFILNNFSLILAQSNETKKYLQELGINQVIYTGNLKFIAANFVFNVEEVKQMKKLLHNRIVLMAASTHPGEEELFLSLHQRLKKEYPQLLTIIAPRHPNRKQEILEIFKSFKLNIATRSNNDKIDSSKDILLVDTIGEFGLFYRLSEVVLVGGSWHKIGHNFIEAAKLGNLIVFGPHMDNSRELSDSFLNNKAAIFAPNITALEKTMIDYLKNPNSYNPTKEKGEKMVNEMNQIKGQVLKEIKPYIKDI